VGGVSNDVDFDPALFSPCATPCVINPAIGSGSTADKQVSCGTVSSGLVRAGVFGFNSNPIPDGLLYTWEFNISSTAPIGAYPLSNTPGATNLSGRDLPVIGASGQLLVTTCTGDCNGNRTVTIGEVVKCINLFLGQPLCNLADSALSCPVADADLDGAVGIGEVLQCVNRFLGGCP
jgi:hypothetical protein